MKKIISLVVGILQGLNIEQSIIDKVVEGLNKSLIKQVKTHYIKLYTKDTQKHKKGARVEITQKSLINQLSYHFKDDNKVKEAMKELSKGLTISLGALCTYSMIKDTQETKQVKNISKVVKVKA